MPYNSTLQDFIKTRMYDEGNSFKISTFSPLTSSEAGMIFLIAIFTTLLVASTIYDLVSCGKGEREKSMKQSILSSFSLYTNCKKLLTTQVSQETMVCLHGLRYLSVFWIILGHTFHIKYISPAVNHDAAEMFSKNAATMLVLNATVTTDTFLLLSGTLLCIIFMREWEKSASFDFVKFYATRYIRLTPPYAFLIFFYATLMYRLGSGPLWDAQIGLNRKLCSENWWVNLLYINNYINVDRMCMNQTWYLAVDMQLYWLSPLLLYPLARWPRVGKILLVVTLLVSIAIPGIITTALHLPAVMLYTRDSDAMGTVYVQIYTRAYARAGPYIIGIILGFMLHEVKEKQILIPKIYVFLGWVVCATSCLAVLLGAATFYDQQHEYSALEAGIYASMHRNVWALGIAWIAFACVKGYGGPVNIFLSWRCFIPLSRLTYCAYLCHYVILLYNLGAIRTPIYLSEYNVLHDFCGNLTFSFVVAAIVSLAIEIPFINLGHVLFKTPHRPPREDDKINGEISDVNNENVQKIP